jgi:hypothetical protein
MTDHQPPGAGRMPHRDFDAWRAGVLARIDEVVEVLRHDDGTWFASDLIGLGEIVDEALTEAEASPG